MREIGPELDWLSVDKRAAFPMERRSAPQAYETAQADGHRVRVSMAPLEFRWRKRVDDYNTEATDLCSPAATESLLALFPSSLRSGVSTFPRHCDQMATQPAPEISEERRQTVETARRSWIRQLSGDHRT
jgi:hypothetical protein